MHATAIIIYHHARLDGEHASPTTVPKVLYGLLWSSSKTKETGKGGKFLKELWCYAGGGYAVDDIGRGTLFAKSYISTKQAEDEATDSENIFATLRKTTKTHLNRTLDTLICRIIPSNMHMSVCGLSLHQGSTESRKTLEQKFIFQIGTLNPHGINERFSFN